MPAFRYEAVDTGGVTRKGVLNADSPRAARADLRLQGLTPLTVDAIAAQVDESGAARSPGVHLSGDRHRGRVRDRDLPADLCGAADCLGVCQYQAKIALPDRDDARRVELYARLRHLCRTGRHRGLAHVAPGAAES